MAENQKKLIDFFEENQNKEYAISDIQALVFKRAVSRRRGFGNMRNFNSLCFNTLKKLKSRHELGICRIDVFELKDFENWKYREFNRFISKEIFNRLKQFTDYKKTFFIYEKIEYATGEILYMLYYGVNLEEIFSVPENFIIEAFTQKEVLSKPFKMEMN